ncbi:sucrase/ferredoxin domain-containing protein [Phaeosphaeriaceae sp. PMI808]|nr:sucrase/ferredoxin domain-containing protein [Phaeosphaeriaceae sp. PMI808]
MRIPLFRIWYSTTYSAVFLLLLLILAITPAETIYQSIKSHELQKLFVIGGVYLLTFSIVLLMYATRIYTNRTVLSAIPKPYVPVEEGEVGRGVRRMIVDQFRRSAIVAWDSRPRDLKREEGLENGGLVRPSTADSKKEKDSGKTQKKAKKKGDHHGIATTILEVSSNNPPWGHVAHPGWVSPSTPNLPDLQYSDVICELPNLIEAKAVSLAPPDPIIEENNLLYLDNAPPLPDAQIVTLLQRPRTTGLRDYLPRLAEFGLLNPPTLGPKFLAQYEYARFSTTSLTETEFNDIMSIFADILNGMTEINPLVIEEARAQSIYSDNRSLAPTESDSDTASSRSNVPYRTPLLERRRPASAYSESLSSISGSTSSGEDSTQSPQTARTAPSRQQQHSPGLFNVPRTPSQRSLHSQSETGSVVIHAIERRSPSTLLPNSSSSSSLRSARSVVRLNLNPAQGELPYRYEVDGD